MTTDKDKTVFISYRRSTSSFIARAIYQNLRSNGYDVFMDVESLDSGKFDKNLLHQIAARKHFVLILVPGSLDRCIESDDWLRREIEYAMQTDRNIVPLILNEFSFSESTEFLTGNLSQLSRYNALNVPHDYFEEAMTRLQTRYFSQPMSGKILTIPEDQRAFAEQKAAQAVNLFRPPTEQELAVERYYSQGYKLLKNRDFDGAIDALSKLIQINPKYALAYLKRGQAYGRLERYAEANDDFTNAIELGLDAYLERGSVRYHLGDYGGSIEDDTETLAVESNSLVNSNRGESYFALGDYDAALEDFQIALQDRPNYKYALAGIAITYHALGDTKHAIKYWKRAWKRLLSTDPAYKDADVAGQELHWALPLIEEARKLIKRL